MDDIESTQLDETERDTLLGNGGTGVLSFAGSVDESPHSIPVSYGYDAAETTFYFRLATDNETTKRNPAGQAVTFVTYRQEEAVWKSVVAQGVLELGDDGNPNTDILAGLERVDIPYVDIFGQPLDEISFEFYRLDPSTLSGRKEQPRI